MEKFYRAILKNAWTISWKNKWLWILGFFAAIIGNGSVYEALLRGFNNVSEGRSVFYTFSEYAEAGIFGSFSWASFSALWQSDPTAFGTGLFTLVVALCVIAILITFGVIGQGAVVAGVIGTDQKKKTDFRKSFHVGVEKFWSILKLNVITKIILLGLLVSLSYLVSFIVFNSVAMSLFVYVLAFIVFVILEIIIYFLTIYGITFIILRDVRPLVALRKAWKLFSKHALLNLEMGFLLFLINIIVGFVFIVVNFIILSPLLVLYLLFLFSGSKLAALIVVMIMIMLFACLMIIVGSWWSTYQLGVWSLLFEKLDTTDAKSKIQRWFESVKNKNKSKKIRK